MEYKGLQVEIEGRNIGIGLAADGSHYMMEFVRPMPEGVTEAEAFEHLTFETCAVTDGKLITRLTLHPSSFREIMSMGLRLSHDIIEEKGLDYFKGVHGDKTNEEV